jgi:hypothetical protein
LYWIKSARDALRRKGRNNKSLSVPLQPQDQLVTFVAGFPTDGHNIKLVAGAFGGGEVEAGAAALSPGVLAAPHQPWPIGGADLTHRDPSLFISLQNAVEPVVVGFSKNRGRPFNDGDISRGLVLNHDYILYEIERL